MRRHATATLGSSCHAARTNTCGTAPQAHSHPHSASVTSTAVSSSIPLPSSPTRSTLHCAQKVLAAASPRCVLSICARSIPTQSVARSTTFGNSHRGVLQDLCLCLTAGAHEPTSILSRGSQPPPVLLPAAASRGGAYQAKAKALGLVISFWKILEITILILSVTYNTSHS